MNDIKWKYKKKNMFVNDINREVMLELVLFIGLVLTNKYAHIKLIFFSRIIGAVVIFGDNK